MTGEFDVMIAGGGSAGAVLASRLSEDGGRRSSQARYAAAAADAAGPGGHDGCMTEDLPPRTTDVFRHLSDLRSGSYEGAVQWPDRVRVFRQAVSLLDPVVRRILEQANTAFLRGGGTINHRAGEDRDGGAYAHWELSWPEQRHATARHGGRVEPIQVIAVFGRGNTHPHLRGAAAGMWPCQVTDAADAERQEPILRAIVECELHERIFQGTWRVVPAFTSGDASPAA